MESNFPAEETNIFGDTPSTSFVSKAQTRSNDSFHTNVQGVTIKKGQLYFYFSKTLKFFSDLDFFHKYS